MFRVEWIGEEIVIGVSFLVFCVLGSRSGWVVVGSGGKIFVFSGFCVLVGVFGGGVSVCVCSSGVCWWLG